MTSLELMNRNVAVIGALPSQCWLAGMIADLIDSETIPETPSLNTLRSKLPTWMMSHHTSPSGSYICVEDWVITCTNRLWTVWSREAFSFVEPPPATSAMLAA